METVAGGGEATNGLVRPRPSPRSPLPPSQRIVSAPMEPSPLPYEKKTRYLPNLTSCHRCGTRRPSKPSRGHLELLRSQWRIVLLCRGCLDAVSSADACSYCFSRHSAPSCDHGQLLDCRQCCRRIHRSCILDHHCHVPASGFSRDCFVCMDCCPYVRPRRASTTWIREMAKDAKAVVAARMKENCVRKAEVATNAVKSALDDVQLMKEPNVKIGGSAPDQEVALQLHLAMNGSQRITRSAGSRSSDNVVDFSEVQEPKSSEICGVVEVCREDRSFVEVREGHAIEYSSMDVCLREEQGSCSGKVENSGGVGCSPSVSDQRLDQSNAAMVLAKCSGEPGEGTYASHKMEEHDASDRYLKKYSKRNWRWKGVVDKEECRIIPCWKLRCSEVPKISSDAPRDLHEISIYPSTYISGLSECKSAVLRSGCEHQSEI